MCTWRSVTVLAATLLAGTNTFAQPATSTRPGPGPTIPSVPVTLNGKEQTLDCLAYLGSWEVRGGEIAMTDPCLAVSGDTGGLSLPVQVLGDFELACEFIMDKGEGNGAGGPVIGFRTQPGGSRYEFRYTSDFNVCVLQKKTRSQPWTEIGYAADAGISAGSWHFLRLAVRGDRFSVAVDRTEVVTGRDALLESGGISLGCTVRPVRFRNVQIKGDRIAAAKAFSPLKEEPFTVVCEDAGLGGYQGFPRLCRLTGGDILCAFYAGWSHTSPPGGLRADGGASALCRSTDGGKTWSTPTIVLDSQYDDNGVCIWQCDDGTVRILSYGIDHKAWVDLKNYLHYYTTKSTDGGRTWSAIAEMVFGGVRVGELNPWTNPLRLKNGHWLYPVYWAGGPSGAGYSKWRFRAGFSRSVDGGHTWGPMEYIEESSSLMDEGDICQFPDGSILCVLRDEKQHMWQTWSCDNGHTWTKPTQLPWYGHSPNLLRTSSGITLLAHRVPGLTVRYSLDNAKTWSGAAMIDPAGGAYSSMVELPNGRILIAYYTEGRCSQVRAQLVDVRRTEIETTILR